MNLSGVTILIVIAVIGFWLYTTNQGTDRNLDQLKNEISQDKLVLKSLKEQIDSNKTMLNALEKQSNKSSVIQQIKLYNALIQKYNNLTNITNVRIDRYNNLAKSSKPG